MVQKQTENRRIVKSTFFSLVARFTELGARLLTHIPGRYEQTVRYYGYYSNKSKGLRKKVNADDENPTIIPNKMSYRSSDNAGRV